MKTLPRLLAFCLGLFLFSLPVQARRHHPAPDPAAAPLATPGSEPAPLPAESAPAVSLDAPPSASLQPFLDTHLGKLLAPLDTSAFAQPEVLTSLKASYADALAAAPASHQPALRLAQSVCDAMNGAMTERQNAAAALRGAVATRSSEAEQPRGGSEAVTTARDKDAFFTDSQKNAWIQRAAVLRQSITALYLRERAAERQVGVWSPAPPAPPAPPAAPANAAALATPSVSAPPALPDPVVGLWMWRGSGYVSVQPDHTAVGQWSGTWSCTSVAPGGRCYEFHWLGGRDVDYLTLTADNNTLQGKDMQSNYFSATRK